MATAATKQTALVTKDELSELGEWERKCVAAKKKVSAAEKELSFRRQSLAERVLGISSKDELKILSPTQIEKILAQRLASGDWKAERGAPAFTFSQTSSGRYTSWKDCYVAEFGETAAARISSETALTYSYSIEVAQA